MDFFGIEKLDVTGCDPEKIMMLVQTIFVQVAMSWEQCKSTHLRAAEAYANSGSLFHAAKQLDSALLVSGGTRLILTEGLNI